MNNIEYLTNWWYCYAKIDHALKDINGNELICVKGSHVYICKVVYGSLRYAYIISSTQGRMFISYSTKVEMQNLFSCDHIAPNWINKRLCEIVIKKII